MTFSYLVELVCSSCQKSFDPSTIQTFCQECQAPLLAIYNLAAVKQQTDRDEISRRANGMWRWHELLPISDPQQIVTLGEGDAPLLRLNRLGSQLGFSNLFVKDESFNPTGSFKARGLAAAISKAKELGIEKVIIPTAGNAGGAMASYAARAGMKACVIMPSDSPQANIIESRMAGAEVILVEGLISDAAKMVAEKARREGWFDVSTFKEPYRCEGKKIMGYELAESLNWTLPDVIIYPTGGGTGLVGMWIAFQQLAALGWLEQSNLPRIVAVQAAGCAPVVKAFQEGKSQCEFWQNAQTLASGLRVPKSFADKIILADLQQSGGTAVAVTDQEILKAQKQFTETEGIFPAPEGAATFAAFMKLSTYQWILPEEKVVLFNTGTGLKYLSQAEPSL